MRRVSAKQQKRNRKLAKIKPPIDRKCQKCGRPANFIGLAKHHKVRRSDGGKDDLKNLEWLCQECHDQMYGEKSRNKKISQAQTGLSGFGYPPLDRKTATPVPRA